MQSAPAALRIAVEREAPPWEHPDPRTSILAALLVQFDPALAREVSEHLEARAAEWDEAADPTVTEHSSRYRTLADLIGICTRISAPASS